MKDMAILKGSKGHVFTMTQELEGREDEALKASIGKRSAPPTEEKSADLRAKASIYALINRPSPPF
jgi:hypothetical protein